MATSSRSKRSPAVARDTGTSLTDDLLATLEVLSEHMAIIAPNAMDLAADIGKMLVDVARSPLGQRARRYPEISFALGALSIGLLARLLRVR